MNTLPLVSLLILFPMLGGLFCLGPWFSEKRDPAGALVRMWAIAIAVLTLVYLAMTGQVIAPLDGEGVPLYESHRWIPSLGISLHFTLDGISFVFCLLTAIVSLAVISWSARPSKGIAGYYALLLAAEGAVLGAFLATDLVLFYAFYELMLLPVLACIAMWGGARRLNAALKFLVYTIAGSMLMFIAILYIGWRGKALVGADFAFDVTTLKVLGIFTSSEQVFLGLAFLLAFAVKIPMVPFHSWLPDTYREAPHAVAAFTAGLLGKVGIYAVIRFMWPLFPTFMEQYGVIFAGLGAVGVVYGALNAMTQRDVRSLLAYSSISHLGFCVLGLGSKSAMALTGAVFQSFSHGIVTAALFLMFGSLIDRQGSTAFDSFGGLASRLPRSALLLMIFTVAAVALPLTSSFVGEFLIVMGSFRDFPGWTILALVGVVLGAVYMLTAYMNIMFGSARGDVTPEQNIVTRDVAGLDAFVLTVLGVLIVALGVWPSPLLRMVEPSLNLQHTTEGSKDGDAPYVINKVATLANGRPEPG